MKRLSNKIENVVTMLIKGLSYDFTYVDVEGVTHDVELDPDKMKKFTDAKLNSYKSAKSMLDKWVKFTQRSK